MGGPFRAGCPPLSLLLEGGTCHPNLAGEALLCWGGQMSRTRADSLRWMAEGTTLLLGALESVPDAKLSDACALPGWSGKHLVAHVSLNAEALMNLATWAKTGVETPMYSSPTQRDS